jgi:biotin carboxylase
VRPKVAVLHHPRSFFPTDLHHQVGDIFEVLWVADQSCVEDAATIRLMRRLGTVVDIAGLDVDQAAGRLAEHAPEGIVTFVDDHVELAAALAARLGLTYHTPEVAKTLVDKRLQRAALHEAGVPGPGFWPLPAGLTSSEAEDLSRQITYPAVLKPAEGSGSRDIHLVTDAAHLLSLLTSEARKSEHLVEEYIGDDAGAAEQWFANYLSVESVISAGEISHVAITGRFPLAKPFRESGNFIPGILPEHLYPTVLGMTTAANDALGIRDAVTHTEIKLGPDGPKLVEVNGRLGGRPPFVLRRVSNINLFEVAFQVAVGTPVAFDGLAECHGVGFWFMLQPPMSARSVAQISGVDDLSTIAGVDAVSLNRRPGEPIDWREGTSSHIVTVQGQVDDYDTLAQTIGTIRDTTKVVYES